MWKHITSACFVVFWMLLLTSCSKHSKVFQGYIEGQFTYITSYVSGNLMVLRVNRGDHVQKNQILFQLDPYPEEADLERAKFELESAKENLQNLLKGQRSTVVEGVLAQLAQANAQLSFALKELNRRKQLYQEHYVSKADLDQATNNYNQAMQRVNEIKANLNESKLGARNDLILAQQATVNSADANVRRLQWLVSQKTVQAPANAIVFDRYYLQGEYVGVGQPVLSILTPENIKLIFYIPEEFLSRIKLGDQVLLKCDGCQAHSAATITFISPETEYTPPIIYSQETRYHLVYRVEASMTAQQAVQFHPGQPVDVKIEF